MSSVILPVAWKIDASIDIEKITIDDLKLIFSQAEKRLDDTVKTGESIASKTMSLVTVMVGLLIGLSGYLISNWKDLQSATHKDVVALTGTISLVVLFFYMIKNVLPNHYYVLGSGPSELMLPSFFDPSFPTGRTAMFLYMNEIENYDYRIQYNLVQNKSRWQRYQLTIKLLLAIPILLGIAYIFLECLD